MMKTRNAFRVLSVLLVLLTIIFSFAACSGGDSNSANSGSTSDSENERNQNRSRMDTVDLAEYAQRSAVTVNADLGDYGTSTGSGFFIDDQGTVVTCYHVIEGAKKITVEVNDGGTYSLDTIVDFDPQYDIAVLKIAYEGNSYLELCDKEVRTGEDAYAVGSCLGFLNGTFTNGIVSSDSRKIGNIDCIQTTADISSGNSGGPLVNAYGEVVGINAFSYVGGENLNLAVKIKTLDLLAMDKNWTINKFSEWYSYETDRSYLVQDVVTEEYYLSMLHTYQLVTGAECQRSAKEYNQWSGVKGYVEGYPIYVYEYNVDQFDKYVEYLTSVGFIFEEKEDYEDGTSYYYIEELNNYFADLYVEGDKLYVSISTS